MKNTINQARIAELKRLSKKFKGTLKPKQVVDAARDPKNPLHDYFEWDDSVAGAEYRIWQARQLMRVVVENIDVYDKAPVNVFVSLQEDRRGGGYRELVKVLSDDELRAKLLEDALRDLLVLQQRYKTLTELAGVFAEVEKLHRAIRGRKARAVAV